MIFTTWFEQVNNNSVFVQNLYKQTTLITKTLVKFKLEFPG